MTPELLYACGRKLGQQVLELEERNRALMSQNRGLISQISQMESAHHSEHVALEGFCQRNVQLETELAQAHETIRRQQQEPGDAAGLRAKIHALDAAFEKWRGQAHAAVETWRVQNTELRKELEQAQETIRQREKTIAQERAWCRALEADQERGEAAALRAKTRALEAELNRLRKQVKQNLRSPMGGSHPGYRYRALNFVRGERHSLTIEEILSQHYADTTAWMAKSREQEEELRELFRPWPELGVKPTRIPTVPKRYIARFRVGGKFARISPSNCTA